MPSILLHPTTQNHLSNFATRPAHALLLSGAQGMGKATVAAYVSAQILKTTPDKLATYPYIKQVRSVDGKSIGIEAIRELEHFLSLKVSSPQAIARLIIVEDAHLLTTEAQNAFLKTLEEPPADTVIILTTAQLQALLPTIRSRLHHIAVVKPTSAELSKLFAGKDQRLVQQAIAMSGGLPGLATLLLDESSDHPLVEAAQMARDLLQKTTFERLLLVDELARRKDFNRDVCFILTQMAHMALMQPAANVKRWQTVLQAAYTAQEQLGRNAQPKLVLTTLMLSL